MPTDQKVTGLSPVGVTLKINHLQQCRWFFIFDPVHNLNTTWPILIRLRSSTSQHLTDGNFRPSVLSPLFNGKYPYFDKKG